MANGILRSEEKVFSFAHVPSRFLVSLSRKVTCIGGGSRCFEVFGSMSFKHAQEITPGGGTRGQNFWY